MRSKHHLQKYIPTKIYNSKVHLGSSCGSDDSKRSKRQVVLEHSMGLLRGLLHGTKKFTLCYRAVQRKIIVQST